MSNKYTISPCPFCGGELSYHHFGISGEHEFKCSDCWAIILFKTNLTEEEAIKACNKRYLIPELVAKLKKVVTWLEGCAKRSKRQAETCNWKSLEEANKADEKNYRATIKDIRQLIAKAERRQ